MSKLYLLQIIARTMYCNMNLSVIWYWLGYSSDSREELNALRA